MWKKAIETFKNHQKEHSSNKEFLTMARNKRGPAGRFGARYGASLRKKVQEVEEKRKAQKQCPDCKKNTIRRTSMGIWKCNKCNIKFAAGAYEM